MNREHQLNLDCRRAVRAHLAERPGCAKKVESIVLGLKHEGGFDEGHVLAALVFLKSKQHVKEIEDDDSGAVTYYEITAEGTLAYERG